MLLNRQNRSPTQVYHDTTYPWDKAKCSTSLAPREQQSRVSGRKDPKNSRINPARTPYNSLFTLYSVLDIYTQDYCERFNITRKPMTRCIAMFDYRSRRKRVWSIIEVGPGVGTSYKVIFDKTELVIFCVNLPYSTVICWNKTPYWTRNKTHS